MVKIIYFALFKLALLLSSISHASEEEIISYDKCVLKIETNLMTGAQGNCTARRYKSKGTRNLYLVRHNNEFVVFSHYLQAGPGLFFTGSGHEKKVTERAKVWNYIKDNFISIEKHNPRTTRLSNDMKVILYEINLAKEKGCLAFVQGFGAGASDFSNGAGSGNSKELGAIVCPLVASSDSQSVLEVLQSVQVNGTFR
jgi:hypothetical protein